MKKNNARIAAGNLPGMHTEVLQDVDAIDGAEKEPSSSCSRKGDREKKEM